MDFKLDGNTISQLEQKAIEAILQITPKKLKEASAKDLIMIATQIRELVKSDSPPKKAEELSVSEILSAIRIEVLDKKHARKSKNEQCSSGDGQGSNGSWKNLNPGESKGEGNNGNSEVGGIGEVHIPRDTTETKS